MTVKELRDMLRHMDPEDQVMIEIGEDHVGGEYRAAADVFCLYGNKVVVR